MQRRSFLKNILGTGAAVITAPVLSIVPLPVENKYKGICHQLKDAPISYDFMSRQELIMYKTMMKQLEDAIWYGKPVSASDGILCQCK